MNECCAVGSLALTNGSSNAELVVLVYLFLKGFPQPLVLRLVQQARQLHS